MVKFRSSMIPFLKTALRTGFTFGLLMAAILGPVFSGLVAYAMWTRDVETEVILSSATLGGAYFVLVGLLTGVPFGLLMAAFPSTVEELGRSPIRSVPLDEGESLVREESAGRIVGKERVGGRLFLTNRRLLFRSLDEQAEECSWLLAHIVTVRQRNLGLLPDGLQVILADGRVEWFSVADWQGWIEALDGASP